MDMNKERPPVEALFMIYNIVLAGVWVLRAAAEPVTPLMVFVHVALAFLLMEMPKGGTDGHAGLRFLAGFYPFVLWALAWSEIGWLYNLTQPVVHDGIIRTWDLALFRIHLNEELAALAPWDFVRNAMGFSYLSYYLLIFGPPVVLACRKRGRDLNYYTQGLISTYLVCFVVYLVMPVVGPREMAQAATEVPVVQGGLFGPVMRAFFAAGDSLGTAFPSSHCAGSVAAALLVGRLFGPAAGRLAGLWAAFIVVSTVYTNNHYLMDAVAGVATGLVIQKLLAVNAARNGVREAGSVMQVSGSGLEFSVPAARKQGS